MKLIIRIILIGTITYLVSPYFTWWTNMCAAFVICFLLPSSMLNAFIAGFLGAGLVWLGQAWVLDVANQSNFTNIILQLFPIDDPILLILVTGLLGGISGGLAGLSGASLRGINSKKKNKGGYYN